MNQDRTDKLKWKYPEFPPRPIKKEVLFSLMNCNGTLYFVNVSDETLDVVSSDSFGLIEDSALIKNPKYYYENVKPNESVKVKEYDDLDYILGYDIYIKSKTLGNIKITPPPKKGGVISQELVYKDLTAKRYVQLKYLDISIFS